MVLFYISLDIYSLLLEVSIKYKISALISALIIAIPLQKILIIPFLFQSYYFIWLFQSIPDWQVLSILPNTALRSNLIGRTNHEIEQVDLPVVMRGGCDQWSVHVTHVAWRLDVSLSLYRQEMLTVCSM